jgi:opacity protein-like surface antigen
MSAQTCFKEITAVMILSLLAVSSSALASPFKESSKRQGVYEITLSPRFVSSNTVYGSNGSRADISSNWGWGFGVGYNLTQNWAFNFDIGWNSFNYTVTAGGVASGSPDTYNGRLDTSSTLFSATYNFMKSRFTPFLTGAFGWVLLDSNIPNGPPGTACWWDPWWGYVCRNYLPTKTSTDFTYGAAIGLRYELSNTLFLRAAYNKSWIDMSNVSNTDFDAVRLDIGFMMQ